jgi:hypothetical protein
MQRYYCLLLWLVIALLIGSNVISADVTLSWTAPGNDGMIGQATTYDIRYSLGPITEANWIQAMKISNLPVPKVSGSKEVFKVTGLSASTTYYFALKTGDSEPNWSKLSNIYVKNTCSGSCIGFTGNIDGSADGIIDVQDLSLLIAYLSNPLSTGTYTVCPEQANVDGSSDGFVDLNDLSRLVAYFYFGTPLAPCP